MIHFIKVKDSQKLHHNVLSMIVVDNKSIVNVMHHICGGVRGLGKSLLIIVQNGDDGNANFKKALNSCLLKLDDNRARFDNKEFK